MKLLLLCLALVSALIQDYTIEEVNSLLFRLRVTTLFPTPIHIDYFPVDNEQAALRKNDDIVSNYHSVLMTRTVQNTDYNVKVCSTFIPLCSDPIPFTTGSLPYPLNESIIVNYGDPTVPMIMGSYPFVFYDGVPQFLYIWDFESGDIVWYIDIDTPTHMFSGYGFRQQLLEGEFSFYVNCQDRLRKYLPDGTILVEYLNHEGPNGTSCGIYHHEMFPEGYNCLTMGEYLLYPDETGLSQVQLSDTMLSWNTIDNRVHLILKQGDFLNPRTDRSIYSDLPYPFYTPCQNLSVSNPQDWTHDNSFNRSPVDGYLVVSSRSLSQVYIFDKYGKELLYKVGGLGSDFVFPNASDRFYNQHSAYLLEGWKLILFDDGDLRPADEGGFYSRGLLLQLDLFSRTATKIWEYRLSLNPNCTSPYLGSAKLLYNKNGYLIDFPTCDPKFGVPSVSYTVELDLDGREVAISMNFMSHFKGNYRSEDVYTISGEYPVVVLK
jgi:hypothetical protein